MSAAPAPDGGRNQDLRRELDSRVGAGEIPGAVWLVARGATVLGEGAVGWSSLVPRRRAATLDTVYDLASLTKPLATAALAVLLAREGVVNLNEPVARRLPELALSPYAGATLLDLLVHRSGLPAWEPLYLCGGSPPDYLRQLARLAPAGSPGKQVLYSDLGYMAAGWILERAAGRTLAFLFRSRIGGPTAVEDQLRFRPPLAWRKRVAPTEHGNKWEQQMAAARAGKPSAAAHAWRQGVIHGQVHDGNCWALGGVAGHAGLFGTARAVAAVAAQFLPGSALFERDERALLVSDVSPGSPTGRSAGFQLAGAPGSAAGGRLSSRSFGHTGFTGTSLFIDPESTGIYVLLTNRVHPVCRESGMKSLRRAFHDLAVPLLGGL